MPVENETDEECEKRRKQQSDAALKWLQQKWTQPRKCPICGDIDWGVNQVFQLLEYKDDGIPIGFNIGVFPVTPVVCNKCGYTFFMNALRSGVVHKKDTNDGGENG